MIDGSLRAVYTELAADDPLKRDIDRIYDISVGLLLAGYHDAQASAKAGKAWPAIGSESPHVYGSFFVVAPDAQRIRDECTRTFRFGDEDIHDEGFFRRIATYLTEYEDQARYIVGSRLYAGGKILQFTGVRDRCREVASIDDPLEHITAVCTQLLPTIANPDGYIGTKTQSALLYGLTSEDTIIVQNTIPESTYSFRDFTLDYTTGKQREARINPVGGGRVVHCSRFGVVRSAMLEIKPGSPRERRIGHALTKGRVENPEWPVFIVERQFAYDPEDKFVHRHKEHALDPAPYQGLVEMLSS